MGVRLTRSGISQRLARPEAPVEVDLRTSRPAEPAEPPVRSRRSPGDEALGASDVTVTFGDLVANDQVTLSAAAGASVCDAVVAPPEGTSTATGVSSWTRVAAARATACPKIISSLSPLGLNMTTRKPDVVASTRPLAGSCATRGGSSGSIVIWWAAMAASTGPATAAGALPTGWPRTARPPGPIATGVPAIVMFCMSVWAMPFPPSGPPAWVASAIASTMPMWSTPATVMSCAREAVTAWRTPSLMKLVDRDRLVPMWSTSPTLNSPQAALPSALVASGLA